MKSYRRQEIVESSDRLRPEWARHIEERAIKENKVKIGN